MISAGSVFCALFALALATLPARRSGGEKPLTAGAAGDSALSTDPMTIAPPTSVTRNPRRRPASISAAPQLGQQPVPGSASTAAATARGSGATPGSAASSGSAPSAASSSALPDPAQVARAVFDAINASRLDAHLEPLHWDPRLQTSAHRHNEAMADADTLSHELPGEDDLGTRESDAGVVWSWAGENIAMSSTLTQPAALDLEAAMVDERPPDDGHRQNILSRDADSVGVDVLFDTVHHRLWLTEDFAQISPT